MSERPPWKITPWGVMSLVIAAVLDTTPILVLVFVGTSRGCWIGAAALALSTWPSTVAIVRLTVKKRDLMEITGGPGISRGGTTYGLGYRRRT